MFSTVLLPAARVYGVGGGVGEGAGTGLVKSGLGAQVPLRVWE